MFSLCCVCFFCDALVFSEFLLLPCANKDMIIIITFNGGWITFKLWWNLMAATDFNDCMFEQRYKETKVNNEGWNSLRRLSL